MFKRIYDRIFSTRWCFCHPAGIIGNWGASLYIGNEEPQVVGFDLALTRVGYDPEISLYEVRVQILAVVIAVTLSHYHEEVTYSVNTNTDN